MLHLPVLLDYVFDVGRHLFRLHENLSVVLEDFHTQVADLQEDAALVHPQGVSEHRHALVVDIEVEFLL